MSQWHQPNNKVTWRPMIIKSFRCYFTGIKHLIRHKMSKKEITKIKQYIKDDRPQRLKSYVRKHHIDLSSVELKHNRNFLHYCCQHGSGTIMRYRKKLKKNSDTWKITVIVLKFDLHGFTTVYLYVSKRCKQSGKPSRPWSDCSFRSLHCLSMVSVCLKTLDHHGIKDQGIL